MATALEPVQPISENEVVASDLPIVFKVRICLNWNYAIIIYLLWNLFQILQILQSIVNTVFIINIFLPSILP